MTPARSLKARLVWLVIALLALVGLALAWSWSPMREWLNLDALVGGLKGLGEDFGFAAAVGGFALALTVAVPLTFLSLVVLVAFGPWVGYGCVLVGALVSGALSYGLGWGLGREVVERLGGERVNQLSRRLASRGVWAVIAVRLVPIAPFAVVNMVAGASHIRLRDLLVGTAVGVTPGTLAMGLFAEQIAQALKQPSALTIGLLVLTVGLIAAGAWGLQRWLRRGD